MWSHCMFYCGMQSLVRSCEERQDKYLLTALGSTPVALIKEHLSERLTALMAKHSGTDWSSAISIYLSTLNSQYYPPKENSACLPFIEFTLRAWIESTFWFDLSESEVFIFPLSCFPNQIILLTVAPRGSDSHLLLMCSIIILKKVHQNIAWTVG